MTMAPTPLLFVQSTRPGGYSWLYLRAHSYTPSTDHPPPSQIISSARDSSNRT